MQMRYIGSTAKPIHSMGISEPLQPGQVIDVPNGYCMRLKAPNGSVIPSIVERATNLLEPADPEAKAAWKRGEDLGVVPDGPTSEQVAARMVHDGEAPAVATLKATGNVEKPKK